MQTYNRSSDGNDFKVVIYLAAVHFTEYLDGVLKRACSCMHVYMCQCCGILLAPRCVNAYLKQWQFPTRVILV